MNNMLTRYREPLTAASSVPLSDQKTDNQLHMRTKKDCFSIISYRLISLFVIKHNCMCVLCKMLDIYVYISDFGTTLLLI